MNTFIMRETTYDSSRPFEVVCIGCSGRAIVMCRYSTPKKAHRMLRVLKARS